MRHKLKYAIACAALIQAGCATIPSTGEQLPAPDSPAAIHDRAITLDSHLDTPALLVRKGFDIMERHDAATDYSQVDLPRMNEGGLDGGFWVIYTPQGPLDEQSYQMTRDVALLRAKSIHDMVAEHNEHFALATCAKEATKIDEDGKKIVFISMENAYPLGTDISLLTTFYHLGLRMVGPVHFKNNQFGDSGTDVSGKKWDGLSPLGKELVKEANRLGIIVDGSHAHDAVFDDIMELTTAPIVLSHNGAKAVYDHPRNISDERLLQLAENGGVIQMNAYGSYLKTLETNPERTKAFGELRKAFSNMANMSEAELEEMRAKRVEIDKKYPPAMADFEDFMDHFLHVLKLIGPDHVGIGADWDGGGGVVGMKDVSDLPIITERLIAEGYSEEDIAKIWGGNLLRVMQAATDASENPDQCQ